MACAAALYSSGDVWRCSAAFNIDCRSLPSCLHLPLQPVSCPLLCYQSCSLYPGSEHLLHVFPGCWRACGGGGAGAPCCCFSSEGCRTAPTSSLSFSVHFVLLNHKGTRDAESFVQVALKARPPEVFKCSLEVD